VNNSFVLFFPFNKFFQKLCSILCNFSLLLNIILPSFAAIPAYATDSSSLISQIEYSSVSHKLNITTNSSEKIEYQLFYKTVDKIDAIAGSDLATTNKSEAFYLGTCSANSVCLPQNVSRGILKIESNSQFYSKFFTLENNVLTVVKEIESSQSDLTDEENNFLENKQSSDWTFEKVELNKEYVSPQNSGVKLTFTKLPTTAGNIKIEEITLTPEQIIQTGSLSDKAYDITSDMVDGSFAYNLSLPIPESSKGKSVDIKFAEDILQIDSAQKVDNTTNSTDTSVSVTNLDHFTIFVVTTPSPVSTDCTGAGVGIAGTDKCFNSIQAAIADLYSTVGTATFTEPQTIEVYSGTYNEAADFTDTHFHPTAANRLILKGIGSPTITNAGGPTIRVDGQDYVTVTGFHVLNSGGYSIQMSGNYGEITNNIIEGGNGYGVRIAPSSNTNPTTSVTGNIAHDNVFINAGISPTNGIAFYLSANINTTAYNNFIINENTHGFRISSSSSDVKIYNNVVVNSASCGVRATDTINLDVYKQCILQQQESRIMH